MQALHFEDPAFVARYVEGPERFVPGYKVMQRMVAQRLAEAVGEDAEVLVLGAGGGLELVAFAALHPGWRLTGLDPSEQMIAQGRKTLADAGAGDRVRWVQGYIPEAPEGPFDAATCLLTLHFVTEDAKLQTLQQIRRRLKPGAPFALVDLCLDKQAADYEARLDRYARFALDSGAEPDDVTATRARVAEIIHTISPAREEALLRDAGFVELDLFYAGFAWRGWIVNA